MSAKPSAPLFSQLIQDFFCQYLLEQRNVSRHTVASYRDAFRLLFEYADRHLGKKPSDLVLTDLDASLILGFLNHLENDRKELYRKPQHTSGSDTLVSQLRRISGPGGSCIDPACQGNSKQALRSSAARLP